MKAGRLILALTGGTGAWFRGGTMRDIWRMRQMLQLLCRPRIPMLIAGIQREPGQTQYRRVLVAVDGSPASLDCIEQARRIAPTADMVLVHALDNARNHHMLRAGLSEEQIQESRIQHHEDAFERLNFLLERAGVAPHEVVKVVENAYPPDLILDTEKSFRADLLVVGRSSASLLRRFFFRAVAPQVLAGAHCDVLLVPAALPSNDTH